MLNIKIDQEISVLRTLTVEEVARIIVAVGADKMVAEALVGRAGLTVLVVSFEVSWLGEVTTHGRC